MAETPIIDFNQLKRKPFDNRDIPWKENEIITGVDKKNYTEITNQLIKVWVEHTAAVNTTKKIEELLEKFNNELDKKIKIWTSGIISFNESKSDRIWEINVWEKNADTKIFNITLQLNEVIENFKNSEKEDLSKLLNDLSNILKIDVFIGSLEKDNSIVGKWQNLLDSVFWSKQNNQNRPNIQVTKKWEWETTAYNWINKSRTDYLNDQITKAGG